MVRILVLTHGDLALALLETARTIAGDLPDIEPLVLDWEDSLEHLDERLGSVLKRMDSGDGVLILTDMYGDTPTNLAMRFLDPGRIEVVTGVNLPMVLRLACLGESVRGVTELAAWIQKKGQRSIRVACVASGTDRRDATGAA
jgi:PTS system mannose-specific IIA component